MERHIRRPQGALSWTCILAVSIAVSCGEEAPQPGGPSEGNPPPPNVLLIVADDLGWGDVGFTGGPIETPHLDRLAAESLVLERFYAAPMCSPSRAQLMTARHAETLGMTRNVKPKDTVGLPERLTTLPETLAAAGYRTALAGKWHLGHGRAALEPNGRGFQSSYGHMRGWIDYQTHFVDGALDWHRDGQPLQEEGYATDLIAAEAQRVLRESAPDQPLFLAVTFNAPHTPLQAPGSTRAATPKEARSTYIEMVQRLDLRIGDILATLKDRGMADSTVVWFLSDNGANPKYGGSNQPLRGGKYTCHEGALRVPACVRFPGRLEPGRTQCFIGTVDVAPTLIAWAGAGPLPGAHGRDAGPDLSGTQKDEAAPTYLFAVDHAKASRRAVLSPPWKLVRETQPSGVTEWLFHVVDDPLEKVDRLAEHPGEARRLRQLGNW